MTIIVTNCSKRKRPNPLPALRANSLQQGTLEVVAREWVARIASATPLVEAGRLYCGRQFHVSSSVAKWLDAELLVMSAGLGVVRSASLVPSYSLTVSPSSSDSILKVVEPSIGAPCWWHFLSRISERFVGLRAALALPGSAAGPILIAMPAAYLEMVEAELEQLTSEQYARTRIFTSPSFRFRQEGLNKLIMPYDRRLDGPNSTCPGTATDFSARALRHFSATILSKQPQGTHQEHAASVAEHLDGWVLAPRPDRARLSDSDLLDVIRANWGIAGGSAAQMLRWIRRDLGLACEQGRMRHLYSLVREEMEQAS